MDHAFIGQLLLNGVVIGLIYGLIAAGVSLQFGILHIVNFAHGEFVMVAMYALALLLPLAGGSYALASVVMLIAALGVGYLAAAGLFGALSSRGKRAAALGPGIFEKSLLLTLGLSIIMINSVQYYFTATPKMVQTTISVGAFSFGWLRITYAQAFAAGLAVSAFVALGFFLMRTNAGRALRAVSQSQDAALMIGLDPVPVARRAIAISILLSTLAAVALAPIYVFQPTIGQSLLLKAFAIVIIGGMGNVLGAALAALALGVLESLVGGLGDTVWQNAIAFLAMIAILIVRPSGLFSVAVRHG